MRSRCAGTWSIVAACGMLHIGPANVAFPQNQSRHSLLEPNGFVSHQPASPPSVQDSMKEERKPNRLIREKSPYLLQHAFNPVDWYPWGEDAFKKARTEHKPIFLSIGYSTCYWCHVMERQVFEDTAIARLMNEHLVCIKVDREERPDIDRVYMAALQAMTGSGGWPMSLFLTEDLNPFYAATYIPPRPTGGRPGFPDLVLRIADLWRNDREKIVESGEQIAELLRVPSPAPDTGALSDSTLRTAYRRFLGSYDQEHGGFGTAPKFPRPSALNFLLRYYQSSRDDKALEIVLGTLRAMASGGIHDHLGGGFHRYSVDEAWRVPHFEKMLYDQAQLAVCYLEAYQITRDSSFADVAKDILGYVSRVLRSPNGGFFSAEDAESTPEGSPPGEKEEGAFYLWTAEQVDSVLGAADAAIVEYHLGVRAEGNVTEDPQGAFASRNILYEEHPPEQTAAVFSLNPDSCRESLHQFRKKLFDAREHRPRPHLDDKILASWNGLMISAYAKAARILDDPRYLEMASSAARFVTTTMVNPGDGTLYRRYRDGEARFSGNLEDYACVASGLIDLYEACFDLHWLDEAVALTSKQIEIFRDRNNGGFFDAPGTDPTVIVRTKEEYDGAEPTGNSVAALNLLRLASYAGREEWRGLAEGTIASFGSRLDSMPEALPQMLAALIMDLSPPTEIVIAGSPEADDTRAALREVHSHFLPNAVLFLADAGPGQRKLASMLPFIGGMGMLNHAATMFLCENFSCRLPTSDPGEIHRALADLASRRLIGR